MIRRTQACIDQNGKETASPYLQRCGALFFGGRDFRHLSFLFREIMVRCPQNQAKDAFQG